MSTGSTRKLDRLHELLVDEATASLDGGAEAELTSLLELDPGRRRDDYMQTAALVQLACLRKDAAASSRMPESLRRRLVSQGESATADVRDPTPVTRLPTSRASAATPRTWRPGGMLGWALAALFALAFVVLRTGPGVDAIDPVRSRSALLSQATDVVTLPWAPPTQAGYEGVTGDVVWSQERQQGYLRLAGMPVNDPGRTQYQLWIVDPERDTHPVDGGVFNVNATGEVVIPIQAKLRILAPTAFAITRERPGGVVVSAGPLLVVAST